MKTNLTSFNFTENQTRALISSLYYIAQKNSGSLPILSLNDSAEVVAYCAGFSSWKEMNQNFKSLNSLHVKNTSIEHPHNIQLKVEKLNNKYLSSKNSFESSKINDFETKIKLQQYPLIDNNLKPISNLQSSTGLLIGGSNFNEDLKYEHLYHLNPQNTLIFSERKDYYNSAINQAILKGKHHIIFSKNDGESSFDYDFLHLDPLNDIYCSDHFDILFSINHEDTLNFDVLWSLIVKDYVTKNNFVLTASFLKYTLSLEFLSFYLLYLKKNKNPLFSLLGKYLNNIGITIKENTLSYGTVAIQSHLDIVKDIQYKVSHLEELYLNGTFVTTQRKSLLESIKERRNLKIFVPDNINPFISHVYNVTLDNLLNNYDKDCSEDNYDCLEYQTIIFNSNENLFNDENLYNKHYSYHIRNVDNFSLMNCFSQIIFSKNSKNKLPPSDWLIKFYTNTENLENLFAFQNQKIQDLNTFEAYLWQKKEKHPMSSLDVYTMSFINPYLK